MAMQLTEDAPAMLALFACGVVGYLAAKRFRQPARIPKQAKKINDDFDEGDFDAVQPAKPAAQGALAADGDSCGDQDQLVGQVPPAAARRSLKSRRRVRKQQGSAQATVEGAGAVPALDGAENAGTLEQADADPEASTAPLAVEVLSPAEEVTPPMSERVAKLLAKKAARKAKKAQEGLQQEVQDGKPGDEAAEVTPPQLRGQFCSEAPPQQDMEKAAGDAAPSEENQAAGAEEEPGQRQERQARRMQSEEHRPQGPEGQQQSAGQEERQELECRQQCQAEKQADPEEAEHEMAVSADQEEKWEEEELEEEWDKEELEEEWEEEEEMEEEWEDEQENQELPWHCRDQDAQQRGPVCRVDSAEWETELSEGSEEWPAEDAPTPLSANSGSWRSWSPSPKWKWQKSYWQEEQQQQQDGWMVPFDELITPQQQPALTGPPVCICQGEEGTFSDGSQVFQPLQSSDGSPLFTDGDQVFMPVCVIVGTPPADKVAVGFPGLPDAPGPGAAPGFEKVAEGEAAPTFDPYNPMGLAAPPQEPDRADVWDTCWG